MINYGRQLIERDDIEAVKSVLESDFLTQGPEVERFERKICELTGSPRAVAVSNGTAALHLAASASNLGDGDRVLVPAVTFAASANCAIYCGAEVEFCDIDPRSLTICPAAAEEILRRARDEGRPFRAMVCVDLAGHPCDMEALAKLKDEYELLWIHDACHSLGAKWRDGRGAWWNVGQWDKPDATVFSFHPVKHITCGEGGMVCTHDHEFYLRLRSLRSHGILKDPGVFVNREEAFSRDGEPNPWYYEIQDIGFNYRLTDIQAALGRSQAGKLEAFVARRREIAGTYLDAFAESPGIEVIGELDSVRSSYHLVVLRIDFDGIGKSRASIMNELRKRGVGTQVHYIPLPLQPCYGRQGDARLFPAAMEYYREALSIPCHPSMSDSDVQFVVETLNEVLYG